MRPVLAFVLAALTFVPPAHAQPPDARRAAATAALVAYGTGDVAALNAAWSPTGEESRRRFVIALGQTLRIHCVDVLGISIDSIEGDTVRATVTRAEGARIVARHVVLTLDAANRIVTMKLAEWDFANELIAKPDAAEALIRERTQLVDDDLAEALYAAAARSVNASEPAKVKTAAEVARRVAGFLGDGYSQARATYIEARAADMAGDPRAITLAQDALALAKASGDADIEARVLLYIGGTLGVQPRARAMYEQIIAMEDRLEDRTVVARAYNNIGAVRLRLSDHAAAMNAFVRAEAISEALDDVTGMVTNELAMGKLLQRQADYDLSFVHLQRAYDVGIKRGGNDERVAEVLVAMATANSHLHRDKEAVEQLKEALVLAERTKSALIQAQAHTTLGDVYLQEKNYPAAINEIEAGLAIARAAKRTLLLHTILDELALTKFEAGDIRGALDVAQQCAAQAQSVNGDVVYLECRTLAGKAHRILGDKDAALTAFRDSVSVLEDVRETILGAPGQRANFLNRAVAPYSGAADLLAERGEVAEALSITEKLKARILLDTLRDEPAGAALTPAEQKRENDVTAHLSTLNRQWRIEKSKTSPDAAAVAKISAEIKAARDDYDALQVELEAAHPRRKATQGTTHITSADEIAPLLGSSTAVIEYLVMDHHTRAFVITSDGTKARLETVSLAAGVAELEKQIGSFLESLAQRDLGYRKEASALYAALLGPLEKAVAGRTTLCIVPHGALWRLPFEALVDGHGRFVVQSHAVFYTPSISVLAAVTRPRTGERAPQMLLAVGNPAAGESAMQKMSGLYRSADFSPLKDAETEVRELRALYGASHSSVLVGADATEERVKREMERSRVLHFATHGIFDEQNPLYSQVVLAAPADPADDGLLGAYEIMGLNLRADIAVLSACETARGTVTAGEGIIGFTWALFVGGCPSSVVSEWKVDSTSTARLMAEFHRHLIAAGAADLGKSDALRAAKLQLLKNPRWRHPFYWSPFVLVGSPRGMR